MSVETTTQRRSVRKSAPRSKKAAGRKPRYQRMASTGLETSKQFYEFMRVKGIPFAKAQYEVAAQWAGDHKTLLIGIAVSVVLIALAGMFFIGYLYMAGYFPTQDQIIAAAKYAQEQAIAFPDAVPKNLLPKAGGMVAGAFSWFCSVLGVSERTVLIFLGGVIALVIASLPFVFFFLLAGMAWLEIISYETCKKIGLGDMFVKYGIIEIYDEE